jgi:Type II intron maturase
LEKAYITNSKKTRRKTSLLAAEAWLIISHYNTLAHGLLSYFRCVDYLNAIKKIVTCRLRYSLLSTLARQHKCSIKKVLGMYCKEIKASGKVGKVVSFTDIAAVTNLKKDFLSKDLWDSYSNLTKSYISLQRAAISAKECTVKNCTDTNNIEMYHVRKLFRNVDKTGKIVIQGGVSIKKKTSPVVP